MTELIFTKSSRGLRPGQHTKGESVKVQSAWVQHDTLADEKPGERSRRQTISAFAKDAGGVAIDDMVSYNGNDYRVKEVKESSTSHNNFAEIIAVTN